MSKKADVIRLPDTQSIEYEASRWLARLDSDRMSDADYDRFREWLDRDELHLRAFREVSEYWSETNTMVEMFRNDGMQPEIRQAGRWYSQPRWLAVAATALVALTLGVWSFDSLRQSDTQLAGKDRLQYETPVGGYREIDLADGSLVKLNTDTRIEVAYTSQSRVIRLHRGEAWFRVAEDSDRPFQVYAGSGLIEALGTAFRVYVKNSGDNAVDEVQVAVTQGRVSVVPNALASAAAVQTNKISTADRQQRIVSSGQQIQFGSQAPEVKAVTLDEAAIDQWRTGMLLFRGESLEYMIAEVSRYNSTRFIFLDDEIRAIKVGGYFDARDVGALLTNLENNFGIQGNRVSKDLVLLSRPDR